jgi:glycosyltransferase involved in cell wall biosynthesis
MKVPVSIVIHTLNEEANLPYAIENVLGWADQICVVDSESTDRTQEIARAYGVEVYSRACTRRGLVEQRNWALDNIPWRNDWVFVLDADEQMDPGLKEEVERIVRDPNLEKDGFWCRFKNIFMGKWIRHASMYPTWSLRLLRHQVVRYERREVNAHPLVVPGREGFLQHHLIHKDTRGLTVYLKRMDDFSSLEAAAYMKMRQGQTEKGVLQGSFFGTMAERRRFLKSLFVRMPFRPLVLFTYLYVIRRGFLDGRAGFDFAIYKAMGEWMTNMKIREQQLLAAEAAQAPVGPPAPSTNETEVEFKTAQLSA